MSTLRDVEAAARAIGLQIQVLNASTNGEIDAAFASLARERPTPSSSAATPSWTVGVSNCPPRQSRHAVPATYAGREFAVAGGLISYGADITDAYREVGVYTGRILKGAKPADLPVIQASKLEFVILSNAELPVLMAH